jgi:hypothetical protein
MGRSRVALTALLVFVAVGVPVFAQIRAKRSELGLTLNLPRDWKDASQRKLMNPMNKFLVSLSKNPQTFVTASHARTGVLMSGGISRQHYPFTIEDLSRGDASWLRRRVKPGEDCAFMKIAGQWSLRTDSDDRRGGLTRLTVDRSPAQLNFLITGSRSARDAAVEDLKKALRLKKRHRTAERLPLAASVRGRDFGVEAVAGRWTNGLVGVEVKDRAPWFLMRKVPDWGHQPEFSDLGVQLVDRAGSREARIMINRMSPVEEGWPAEQRRLAMIRDFGVKPEAKPLLRAKVLGENTKFYRLPVPRPTIAGIVLRNRNAVLILVQGRDVADMEPAELTELGLCVRTMSDEEADVAMSGLAYSPRALRVDEPRRVGLGATLYDLDLGLSWTQPASGAWRLLSDSDPKPGEPGFGLEAPGREGRLSITVEAGTKGESPAAAFEASLAKRFPKRRVLESEKLLWCGLNAQFGDLALPEDRAGAESSKEGAEPPVKNAKGEVRIPTELRLLVAPTPEGRRIVVVGAVPEGAPEIDWQALRAAMLAFAAAPEIRTVEEGPRQTRFRRWGLTLDIGKEMGPQRRIEAAPADEAGLRSGVWQLRLAGQTAELQARRLDDEAIADDEVYRQAIEEILASKRFGSRARKSEEFQGGDLSGRRLQIRDRREQRELLIWRVRGILWTLIAPVDADPMPWLEAMHFAD